MNDDTTDVMLDIPDMPLEVRQATLAIYNAGFQAGDNHGFQRGHAQGFLIGSNARLDDLVLWITQQRSEVSRLQPDAPGTDEWALPDTPILALDLKTVTINNFKTDGIHTVGDILQRVGDNKTLKGLFYRFGPAARDDLDNALKKIGYHDLPPL